MRERLLSIFIVVSLVALALAGCSQGSPDTSTLTILSITDGDVFVMEAGTDTWTEAEVGMTLEVGDKIKTGDDSGAAITFFDGSTIELQAGTEIEILSLDTSADTGSTTITLEQTIGTTISRVTALLDPTSSYEIETSTGVAAVRGSVMIVTVGGDGTTLITNQEGNVYAFGQGVELPIPEGRTGIIASGQEPEIMNDSPVAEDDGATTDEDNSVTVAALGVLSNDSDPDANDTLTVTAIDTSGTVGAVDAWSADGSFTYDPAGQFEDLQAGNSTTDSFTYTVSDSYGGIDAATVTISINGVNDQPVALNDTATTTEDTPVIIDVLNNDSDIDGDTLTVVSASNGTYGSVAYNATNVTYSPALNFTGSDEFDYIISDGNGGTATATVAVNVTVITLAEINVQIDKGSDAPIFIWDGTAGGWAVDLDTQWLVNGTNHETPKKITVAGGHYYYVWVEAANVTYYVKGWPDSWIVTSAPGRDCEASYGYAGGDAEEPYSVHFTNNPDE
jgi:VCBS repeat-containing protein